MFLLSNPVTIADFILALEEEEVLELSELYNPCGNEINGSKIQQALDRAIAMINSRFVMADNCGRAYLKLNSFNLVIWIARHLLDTVKARPHVVEDFERAMQEIEKYSCRDCSENCPLTDAQICEILGEPCPSADKNFRFNSDCRKWNKRTLRTHQRQLFDHRSVETVTTDKGFCKGDNCSD